MAVPILDNHEHMEPVKGRHVDSVREFEQHGGTHVVISHLPYEEVPVKIADDFRTSFDLTISLKDRVNRITGVKAYATVGPYSAQILELEKLHGLARAKEIMLAGMDIAAEYVKEGKALAIGEVGGGPRSLYFTIRTIRTGSSSWVRTWKR